MSTEDDTAQATDSSGPVKCAQCDNLALYLATIDEAKVPFCLHCFEKWGRIVDKQTEMMERQINYLADAFDFSAGFRVGIPRYPERRPPVVGEITMNNINISESAIGVLNTGSIRDVKDVDVAVDRLNQEGNIEVADALTKLTEAVASTVELGNEQREEILESLSLIATEAALPPGTQQRHVARAVLLRLPTLLAAADTLSRLWEKYGPPIVEAFSNPSPPPVG